MTHETKYRLYEFVVIHVVALFSGGGLAVGSVLLLG